MSAIKTLYHATTPKKAKLYRHTGHINHDVTEWKCVFSAEKDA